MKFTEIFQEVRKHWPDQMDISNGEILPKSGSSFPEISTEWDRIELLFDENDDWHGLMVWSMFGVIKKFAKEKFLKGEKMISLNEIDIKSFEEEYYKDLHEEDYEDMLREYVNDLKD